MPVQHKHDGGIQPGDDDLTLPRVATFLMYVGPGAAIGFYLSMVGFYVAHFESRVFYLAMIFCIYLPAPLLWLLQQRFDAWFDATYTAQVAYAVRVMGMTVLLMCVTLCWAASAQTPYFVLAMGFAIGVCSQTIILSSGQLMGVMHPSLTTYIQLGFLAGCSTPVAVVLLSGFSPTSHLWKFQMVVLVVPALCLVCACLLLYIYLTQDIFQSTCLQLTTQSLHEIASRDDLFYDTAPSVRQKSDPGVVPYWVWLWCGYASFSMCCSTSVMALTAFFGNPAMAQTLGLSKLFVDVLGAILSLPLPQLESFSQNPWHKFLLMCGAVRTFLFSVLMVHLGGPHFSGGVILLIWVLFHGIHAVTGPHASVTIAAFVDMSDRKRVMRVLQGSKESGAIIGLSLASAVLVPALNLGSHWPAAGRSIVA